MKLDLTAAANRVLRRLTRNSGPGSEALSVLSDFQRIGHLSPERVTDANGTLAPGFRGLLGRLEVTTGEWRRRAARVEERRGADGRIAKETFYGHDAGRLGSIEYLRVEPALFGGRDAQSHLDVVWRDEAGDLVGIVARAAESNSGPTAYRVVAEDSGGLTQRIEGPRSRPEAGLFRVDYVTDDSADFIGFSQPVRERREPGQLGGPELLRERATHYVVKGSTLEPDRREVRVDDFLPAGDREYFFGQS